MSTQREHTHRNVQGSETAAESQAKERARYSEAWNLVAAASDVLQHKRSSMIGTQPAVDAAALWMLLSAVTGEKDGKRVSGSERRALFDAAMRALGPSMTLYAQDEAQRDWISENIEPQLEVLNRDIAFDEADDRVRGAVILPGQKVLDTADDSHPREQGEALHDAMAKLVETLRMLNEAVLGLHEESLKEEIARILQNEETYGLKVGSLVELGNALSVIDGFLLLTDEELMQRLHDVHQFWPALTNYSELVKGVALLVGGTLGVVTSTVGIIAKAAGEPEIAAVCAGAAQGVGLKIAKIVAVAEVVHSIATLVDWRHLTRQQKMDAVVGGVGSATSAAAKWLPEAVGAPVTAATLGYAELKLALNLYWGGAEGLVSGLMGPAFSTLEEHGRDLAGWSEVVLKAQALVDAEQDSSRKDGLERVLKLRATQLGEAIDSLLNDLAAPDLEAGMARQPGAYKILSDACAPVWAFKGVRSAEGAMIGASVALSCLAWVHAHQAQIVEAASAHRGLSGVHEPRVKEGMTDGNE